MSFARKEATKIVAASLLGDGSVTKDKPNARFHINIVEKNRDHMEYLQERLSAVCPLTLNYLNNDYKEVVICGVTTHRTPTLQLRSRNNPFYNNFRERMYPNGYKVVDPHYLTLLDWEFLAVWYMQDGTLSKVNKTKEGFRVYEYPTICSDNFSYGDHLLLKKALHEKIGLIWNIKPHTNGSGNRAYRLHLYPKQLNDFSNGVMPFMQPSFHYKIPKLV